MIRLFKVATSPKAVPMVESVLQSGYIGEGNVVSAFEAQFSRFVGRRALMVNSGTSAIHLALHLAGVGPGTEVISTPMTCSATNVPILHLGATIMWADVDPLTGLIDPASVARKLTVRTKAVVAVNWGGMPCDFDDLRNAAPGIPIIEDAAHGPYTGNDGDYVCWSFQAIKYITTGDGGALSVPVSDHRQHRRAQLLRWFGLDRDREGSRTEQDIEEAGYKFQMNNIAAAIGMANLQQLDERLLAARKNAEFYGVPNYMDVPRHSFWLYTMLIKDRDEFMARMKRHGIETSRVHRRNDELTCFAAFRGFQLPGVDHFNAHNVAIPVGWWLTQHEREKVAFAAIIPALSVVGRPIPRRFGAIA